MSTLPNIFPAAKAGLFQDSAAGATPEKNSGSSEQFADWMSRALSPGLSAKSPAPGETLEAGASEVVSAVKTDLFSGKTATGLLENSLDNKGQFDEVASGAAALTVSGKSSVAAGTARIVMNLPPALPETGTQVSVTKKKSKPDGKTSDSGHAKPVENQSVANLPVLPENVSVVINPEVLPLQNPVPVLPLTESLVNLPADNVTGFQPVTPVFKSNSGPTVKNIAITSQLSSSLPVALNVNAPTAATVSDTAPAANALAEIAGAFPETKNAPVTTAKISDPVFSQNQPDIGDVSKIQTDSRKKITPAGSTAPAVRANPAVSQITVDPKTAALTPVASQIPSAPAAANLKTPKTAAATATDFSPPELSGLPVPDGKTVVPTASFADGTSAAKQEGLVGGSEKTSKIAVLAGKFLPGSAAVGSRGNDLSPRVEQIFTAPTTGVLARGESATVAVSAVENSLADDVRAQALERAHDAIALHAVSLSGAGADSLQVVIKPGAGTQLSLELRQRGDGVEVQAVLQQGDFKHLNQQWPELQQRLEQRGIKLTSLATDGNFANGGSGEMFQQRKNQAENQPVGTAAEMSFSAPVTGTFTKPAARAVAAAGWETWA